MIQAHLLVSLTLTLVLASVCLCADITCISNAYVRNVPHRNAAQHIYDIWAMWAHRMAPSQIMHTTANAIIHEIFHLPYTFASRWSYTKTFLCVGIVLIHIYHVRVNTFVTATENVSLMSGMPVILWLSKIALVGVAVCISMFLFLFHLYLHICWHRSPAQSATTYISIFEEHNKYERTK